MLLHNCLKARTQDFKCLGATYLWTFWTSFDGHSDTSHIFRCHSSWKICGGDFTENTAMLAKIFNSLWNWSTVWKSCTRSKVEMLPEGASRGHKTLIIVKKFIHSKPTLLHTPPMHDEWIFRLSTTWFFRQHVTWISVKLSISSSKWIFVLFQYFQK